MTDDEDVGRAADGTPPMACRGLRGATTVARADQDEVEAATAELLDELVRANGFDLVDVAAAIFTLTDDLAGTNPAAAARARGWSSVPMLLTREHGGDTRVANCLRVLLLVNMAVRQPDVRHVYLREAAELRPDLATLP